MSRSMCSHAYVLGSMSSTCFMLSSMCLCASHLVYVLRLCAILALVCHAMCYFCPFIPFYRIFLCFGLMVTTRAKPYTLCHRPYTKVHIKGFGSSYLHVYACLLLCFILVLASLVLGFATLVALSWFVAVWLHLTLVRPCLNVTIWDASP